MALAALLGHQVRPSALPHGTGRRKVVGCSDHPQQAVTCASRSSGGSYGGARVVFHGLVRGSRSSSATIKVLQ